MCRLQYLFVAHHNIYHTWLLILQLIARSHMSRAIAVQINFQVGFIRSHQSFIFMLVQNPNHQVVDTMLLLLIMIATICTVGVVIVTIRVVWVSIFPSLELICAYIRSLCRTLAHLVSPFPTVITISVKSPIASCIAVCSYMSSLSTIVTHF